MRMACFFQVLFKTLMIFFFFSFSRLLGVGKIADVALLVCETGMLPPACSVASILGFGLEWSTVWGDTKAEDSWRFQLQQ